MSVAAVASYSRARRLFSVAVQCAMPRQEAYRSRGQEGLYRNIRAALSKALLGDGSG